MVVFLAIICCLLALIPAVLFIQNLSLYAPLPNAENKTTARCSVLIPTRNEERNIGDALRSILHSTGIDLEVIVLDDGSSDSTAEIVRSIGSTDSRVRLETALPLPSGWCGKNFACQQLASLASHSTLIYMDADVRVSRPDSLVRLTSFLELGGVALASGVPREITGGLMEKLIIPLIHFVLLGFLPLRLMRSGTDPGFAAACGQILAVKKEIYLTTGGHGAVPDRIHDAVALTRHLRAQGFTTDLFDATEFFSCRMYETPLDVWNGFAKNAHEGLGSRQLILPATAILFCGQVLPFIFLLTPFSVTAKLLSFAGAALALLPRILAAIRFQQSWVGVVLHPFAIVILLAIQWSAWLGARQNRSSVWKGRSYSAAP